MIGLLSNPEVPDSPLIVHRFTVRPFGEKNSPFILNSVVKSNLGRNESLVTAHMQRSVFVNKISGCESEIEANFHFKPGASTVSKWRRNLLRKESSMLLVNLNPWFNMEPCGWYVKYSNSEYSLSSGKNYETRYLKDTALFYDPLAFHSPLATSAKIRKESNWMTNVWPREKMDRKSALYSQYNWRRNNVGGKIVFRDFSRFPFIFPFIFSN